MTETQTFAEKIHARYPEGLTGVIVVAGTRTMYILENNQAQDDPGKIDFEAYTADMYRRYMDFIPMFYRLGGQNLIIPVLSYQSLYERGDAYVPVLLNGFRWLYTGKMLDFYREHKIDPHFVGTDTLQHLPEGHLAHEIYEELETFARTWPYDEKRRKLIWEVIPIPLYSYWRLAADVEAEMQQNPAASIHTTDDLRALRDRLYKIYTRKIYGLDIPIPHFYIGSNRNGELKLRSMYPISMQCGDPFRLYYVPYPTLYLKEPVMQAIFEDLAFGKPLRAKKKDYSGQFTPEMIAAERERIQKLANDPSAVVGLTRQVTDDD